MQRNRSHPQETGVVRSLIESPIIRRRVKLLAAEFVLIQVLDRVSLLLIQKAQMRRRKKFFQERYLN